MYWANCFKEESMKNIFFYLGVVLMFISCEQQTNLEEHEVNMDDLLIRVAEIEIDSASFDEYITILKEEAEASIQLEPGVLCIYPMYQKGHPTQIRLLEIYANREAYEAHLKTPHFLHYKTTTMPMVKSLNLVDMEAIDKETMSSIFRKIK